MRADMLQESATTRKTPRKSCFSTLIPDVPLKLALVCFTVAVSSMFQYGYALSYINTAQINFMDYLNQSVTKRYGAHLDENAFSWIWSAIVNCEQIGFVVGTLLIPFFAEKYGRKWCLLMSILPEALGTGLAAAAIPLKIPFLLGIGRFILSVGLGISCNAATLFFQETSPTRIRGFISSFQEFATCLSCLIGMVIGLPMCLGAHLPYLISLGMLGACPRLVLIFCPETPKYLLLRKHDLNKACQSIVFYHGKNSDLKSVINELDMEGKLEDESLVDNGQQKVSKLKQLWSDKHIRKATIIGIIVFLATQFTGVVPLYEYSTDILVNAGLSQHLAEFGTLLMAICSTISTVVSIFIVEHIDRRKLLLLGLVGIIVSLLSLTVFDILYNNLNVTWAGYGSMVSIVCHTVIFSIGPGPICWFITSELVPQHVRSSALAFTQLWNMVANLSISFIFFPLFTALGAYTFVILCIIPTALCILYLYFALPETRNCEISNIVMKLKSKRNTRSIELDK